jgi:hypothetical protein
VHDHIKQELKSLDFAELESFRRLCKQIRKYQSASLKYFKYEVGFQHVRGHNKISVSSSATCVLSLRATGNWGASKADTKTLLAYLLSKDKSAGLESGNPFTAAWILEAVTALEAYSEPLDANDLTRIATKEAILQKALCDGGGSVSISKYPGSAYLTQLVVRVLRSRNKFTPDLKDKVGKWAWTELTQQLALAQAKSKTQDPFAFAYLLMLVTAVTPLAEMTPEKTSFQRSALQTVFDRQLPDGTWPLSRPLFHYPDVGNAHCYEYEMLTQLLQEAELRDLLLDHLPELSLATQALVYSAYRLEKGVWAWASGHHPQLKGPESWTTASVFHFVYWLDRLLAEAVRRELFNYLDLPLAEPAARNDNDFEKGFLDSVLNVRGKEQPLISFLKEHFVRPLADEAPKIADGGQFKKSTPISAIFFGPPGTSKTELSQRIANYLGWPLLSIDPSHLLRNGMDGIQAEANAIFQRLAETERVVVLLDEFDEFVKERGSSDAEQFSRLLTTAMLPKLASIHKGATLVFIIATNNIRQFDLAIQRPGRFDRLVQIMPPTYNSKITKKDWGAQQNIDFEQKLPALGVILDTQLQERLGDLTYLECDAFATELAKANNTQEAISILEDHWKRCILQTIVKQDDKQEDRTWKERSEEEAQFNR